MCLKYMKNATASYFTHPETRGKYNQTFLRIAHAISAMPLYHITLLRLKQSITEEQAAELKADLEGLTGKIPGLVKISVGPPLSADRARGYTLGAVALLRDRETLAIYAEHPEHVKMLKYREFAEELLSYDLEC